MCDQGAKLVGVIEQDTGIYNSEGFNPDEVKLYKEMHGTK
jgi:glutamate dehydrogenase/leucine dehydrogenase